MSDFEIICEIARKANSKQELQDKLIAFAEVKLFTLKKLLEISKENLSSTTANIFVNSADEIFADFLLTTPSAQLAREGLVEKVNWLRELGAREEPIHFGYAMGGLTQEQIGFELSPISLIYGKAFRGELSLAELNKHDEDSSTFFTALFGYLRGNHLELFKSAYEAIKDKSYNPQLITNMMLEPTVRKNKKVFTWGFNEFIDLIDNIHAQGLSLDATLNDNLPKIYSFCNSQTDKSFLKKLQKKIKIWGFILGEEKMLSSFINSQYNTPDPFKLELKVKLADYLEQRRSIKRSKSIFNPSIKETVAYYYFGIFSFFSNSYSFKQKEEAVNALLTTLEGHPVELKPHLGALRSGDLGKTIRSLLKSPKADHLFAPNEKRTVSAFIERLENYVKANPAPTNNS